MKLKDVKHIIDAYFDALQPLELVRHLESLGYEFEPIEEIPLPQTVADFSEILGNSRFKDTFTDSLEKGVLYLPKSDSQVVEPTEYPVGNYAYAMAA
jgi:hypothetical protein